MAGISTTVVNLKPGKMEEVTKFIDSQSSLVTELEGIIGFGVAVTGEDELTIIGVYQSSQNARDASDTVQKVFSEMADFLDDFGIHVPNTVNPYQSETMENHDFELQIYPESPSESKISKNLSGIVFHYVRTVCSPIYSS